MHALTNLLSSFTASNGNLNPAITVAEFKTQFRSAIDNLKGDEAMLLMGSTPITWQLAKSDYFNAMLIDYLDVPNKLEQARLLCSCLGNLGYVTPFIRLGAIIADLSLKKFENLDGQISLLSVHLEKKRELPLSKYVQDHLERFQVERRHEIATLLCLLQHYIHKERPFEKSGYHRPIFLLPEDKV